MELYRRAAVRTAVGAIRRAHAADRSPVPGAGPADGGVGRMGAVHTRRARRARTPRSGRERCHPAVNYRRGRSNFSCSGSIRRRGRQSIPSRSANSWRGGSPRIGMASWCAGRWRAGWARRKRPALMGPSTSWAPTVLETGELGTPPSPAAPVGPTPTPAPAQVPAPKPTARCSSTLRPFDPLTVVCRTASNGSTKLPVRAAATVGSLLAHARATGRPLLANDPHLGIEMPSIWYEMHLVATDLDVAGATIPGAPFVVIGHNATIAWGLTNTRRRCAGLLRRRRGLQEPPLSVRQPVAAAGGPGREHRCARPRQARGLSHFQDRHGPGRDRERVGRASRVLRSGWTSDRPAARPAMGRAHVGESAGAFLGINRAANWDDFLDAVRRFGAPSQNFVYADIVGNIGYAMSGALPFRAQGDGPCPCRGMDGNLRVDRAGPSGTVARAAESLRAASRHRER